MQLIQDGSQTTATIPAKNAAVGTPGYAFPGPPGSTASSRWSPDVANTILAELIAILTAASLSPDPTNNAQVLASLKVLFQTGRLIGKQTFTLSGTYTPDPLMKTVIFEVQGGGGAGGGGAAATGGNVSLGAPGTSGAYAKGLRRNKRIGAVSRTQEWNWEFAWSDAVRCR